MKQDIFLSYLARGVGVLILFGVFFTLNSHGPIDVNSYKVNNDMTYTGKMNGTRFEGAGRLRTGMGTYEGNFTDGRMEGAGIFYGDGYTYMATFNKNGNTNPTIELDNGEVFEKVSGIWLEKGKSNAN